ncbi:type 4a pilus biogenesis protein PilO [bacterium]|nr:type 4a pilus biogenesis protein PilO [bacterium]
MQIDKSLFIQYRWPIIGGSVFFLALLLVLDCVLPVMADISEIRQSTKGNMHRARSVSRCEEQIPGLIHDNERLGKVVDELVLSQNEDAHISRLVKMLGQKAKANRIRIISIDPKTRVSEDGVISLPIHLEFNATFHNVGRFINAIEQSKSLIRVDEIKLESIKIASTILKVEAVLIIYFAGRQV